MRSKLGLIILLVVAVAQFAQAEQQRLVNEHYLDVGNQWVYDLHVTHHEDDGPVDWSGTYTVTMTGNASIEGYNAAIMEKQIDLPGVYYGIETDYLLFYGDYLVEVKSEWDEGVTVVRNSNPSEYVPIWIDDSDYSERYHGRGEYYVYDDDGTWTGWEDNWGTFQGRETISVDAGTFECFKFATRNDWQSGNGWYGHGHAAVWIDPDIGVIKAEIYEWEHNGYTGVDGHRQSTIELTSTNVTPPTGDSYEPDDTSAQANWIYSGIPQTHSIVPAGDTDWVKFSLSTESEVIIETSGSAWDDTVIWLYDSSSLLEGDDDSGSYYFSRIDRLCGVDALPAGTYYVVVAAYYDYVEIQSYNITLTVTPCDGSGTSPVYRFWSPVNSRHFYTMVEAEKDKLINLYAHVWTFESIAYYAFETDSEPGLVPVYRFWSPPLIAHFYTISESERDKLINNYPHVWTYEDVAYYAYAPGQQPAGACPVYRFWSPVLETHFYTTSETEKNKLIDNYPHVWTYESVAWYALCL